MRHMRPHDTQGAASAGRPLLADIDRHLAQGRAFLHAPLTSGSIPVVRAHLAEAQALAGRLAAAPLADAARADGLRRAAALLGQRLRAAPVGPSVASPVHRG